jgi:hypothetical protein
VGGGDQPGPGLELIQAHGQQHRRRSTTGRRQLVAGEQAGGGIGQGIVHTLTRAARVRPVHVGGSGCGERVEHGLPLRQRRRGEPRPQVTASVTPTGQRGVAAPLMLGVAILGPVRVDPLE